MLDADQLIARLGLVAHPEGGHYRQTFRDDDSAGRPASTAIYYLLKEGERSHWHKVDAGRGLALLCRRSARIVAVGGMETNAGASCSGPIWPPARSRRSSSPATNGRRLARSAPSRGWLHRGPGLRLCRLHARPARLGTRRLSLARTSSPQQWPCAPGGPPSPTLPTGGGGPIAHPSPSRFCHEHGGCTLTKLAIFPRPCWPRWAAKAVELPPPCGASQPVAEASHRSSGAMAGEEGRRLVGEGWAKGREAAVRAGQPQAEPCKADFPLGDRPGCGLGSGKNKTGQDHETHSHFRLHIHPESILGLDPVANFAACLAHVEQFHPDADRIVITGDLAHRGLPDSYRSSATCWPARSSPASGPLAC